jgi:predicted DNA-binding transcriptional regulator AlpA
VLAVNLRDQSIAVTIGSCGATTPDRAVAQIASLPADLSFRFGEVKLPALRSEDAPTATTMPSRTDGVSNPLLYAYEDLRRLGIKLSHSTLLRHEAKGKFPKRVRLGAHSIAWVSEEILEYIDALMAARGSADA